MKIVLLLTLIPAIVVCIESHIVSRDPLQKRPPVRNHMLHRPPAKPNYGPGKHNYAPAKPSYVPAKPNYVPANPGHCHGPNDRECFERTVEYASYLYYDSPYYPYYYYYSYRPMQKPAQGLPQRPPSVKSFQNHPPVQRPPARRYKVPKNPDHCHGPNSDDCFIKTVEYPSQYSAEHTDVLYDKPFSRSFCPKRYSWPCYQSVNECCSDKDCHPIQFCCYESCGNTCQFPVSLPTDGWRVQQNDPRCRVASAFLKN